MGLVIRAHNMAIDERVAIKLMRDDVRLDSEHVERFVREARACVRLKSEHVAKIRDVGTLEDGRPYMVMELLEGLDLGKYLLDHGVIEPTRAVDLILQACDGLAEAHSLGIVHRDIKPTNLFLTKRRDDTDLLKVLDFGISKAQAGTEMSLTQTSSMLGTPAYMSPEQMRSARTADRRSDIWALGTVLYELVEGRLPFEAPSFAELCVMVAIEPPAPMTRAPHLQRVMQRCLAKSLEERYQDIGELAFDLAPYASDPGRASRQVQRILRVLGNPPSRESGPIQGAVVPMTRDSLNQLGGRPPTPAPASSASSGMWKSVVLLLLLFGIGIGAGLYVTSSSSVPQQAVEPTLDAAVTDDPVVAVPDAAAAPAAVPAGTSDAAVSVTPEVDAGAGSAAAPPVQVKPPPRKPPPRKPRTTTTGGGSGSATAPPKKCDPFANPKGCK
jgi:serine/threonine-protein kinase